MNRKTELDMKRIARFYFIITIFTLGSLGCSQEYKGVVRPTKAAALSNEISTLTEASIEHHLKLNPEVSLPTVLAVAKLDSVSAGYGTYGGYSASSGNDGADLAVIQGEEAERWRSLTKLRGKMGQPIIEQVQLITPIVCKARPSLKDLRDSAAMLHAPLLLVYSGADTHAEGVNSAAMAYWTIVGLFVVPGNTVGHYTASYAVLIDTQTGGIVATAEGESKKEENVLYGATEIAGARTRELAGKEALANLDKNIRESLVVLNPSSITASTEGN